MTQGTKSFLFGCHQFFLHPLWVFIAWRKHFGRYPKFWEAVCILIHDVGIVGRQYLEPGGKKGHWKEGAYWALQLFGYKGLSLCAGHTRESRSPRSDLFWADKKSWLVAPRWWLWSNYYLERFGNGSVSRPPEWREMVRRNLERENPKSSHELFETEWLSKEA